MKVIINQDNQQPGVFIPLEEWDEVRSTVKKDSMLHHLLSREHSPSIFEKSPEELKALLQPVGIKLAREAYDQGLYTTHPVEGIANQFLHRYADGRIELIAIDESTGKEQIISQY